VITTSIFFENTDLANQPKNTANISKSSIRTTTSLPGTPATFNSGESNIEKTKKVSPVYGEKKEIVNINTAMIEAVMSKVGFVSNILTAMYTKIMDKKIKKSFWVCVIELK
jgi:hypothetical protein